MTVGGAPQKPLSTTNPAEPRFLFLGTAADSAQPPDPSAPSLPARAGGVTATDSSYSTAVPSPQTASGGYASPGPRRPSKSTTFRDLAARAGAARGGPAIDGAYSVDLGSTGQTLRHIERFLDGDGRDRAMPAPEDRGAAIRDELARLNPGELVTVLGRLPQDRLEQALSAMSPEQRASLLPKLDQTDAPTIRRVGDALERLNEPGSYFQGQRLKLALYDDPATGRSGAPEKLELRYTGTEGAPGSSLPEVRNKDKLSASAVAKLLQGMSPNETKAYVQRQVSSVLEQHSAAIADPKLSKPQRQERQAELKRELAQLRTDLQESGMTKVYGAEVAAKEVMGSAATMLDGALGMLQASETGSISGIIAASGKLGKGFSDTATSLLRHHKADPKLLEGWNKAVGAGASGIAALAKGWEAVELFGKKPPEIAKGIEAALGMGVEGFKAFSPYLEGKVPKELLGAVGQVAAGAASALPELRQMMECWNQGDKAGAVKHGMLAGPGAISVLGPVLQKAGIGAEVLGQAAGLLTLGADAIHLAPHVAKVMSEDWSLREDYIESVQEIAKVAGADFVGALVFKATGGKSDAALMARGAALGLGTVVQGGVNEYADNYKMSDDMQMRVQNSTAMARFATDVLGFKESDTHVANFQNGLKSGDEATKLLLRGIVQLAKTDRAAATEALKKVVKDGKIKLSRERGHGWEQ